MSHVVCTLPIYTEHKTLDIPAYISGMYGFKEFTIREAAAFINCKTVPNSEGFVTGKLRNKNFCDF